MSFTSCPVFLRDRLFLDGQTPFKIYNQSKGEHSLTSCNVMIKHYLRLAKQNTIRAYPHQERGRVKLNLLASLFINKIIGVFFCRVKVMTLP